VGAYTGSASPYGAFDMAGNVQEWDEAISGLLRGDRGGAWRYLSSISNSFIDGGEYPTLSGDTYGFRLASIIPEPSGLVLAAFGFAGLAALGWRRRQRLGPS
jgi:hypothetical protein